MVGERKTLAKIAKEKGFKSVDSMVKNAIEQHGTLVKASASLGVTMGAIQMWLSRNQYHVVKVTTATIQKIEVV